jgi:hypothetical protein
MLPWREAAAGHAASSERRLGTIRNRPSQTGAGKWSGVTLFCAFSISWYTSSSSGPRPLPRTKASHAARLSAAPRGTRQPPERSAGPAGRRSKRRRGAPELCLVFFLLLLEDRFAPQDGVFDSTLQRTRRRRARACDGSGVECPYGGGQPVEHGCDRINRHIRQRRLEQCLRDSLQAYIRVSVGLIRDSGAECVPVDGSLCGIG